MIPGRAHIDATVRASMKSLDRLPGESFDAYERRIDGQARGAFSDWWETVGKRSRSLRSSAGDKSSGKRLSEAISANAAASTRIGVKRPVAPPTALLPLLLQAVCAVARVVAAPLAFCASTYIAPSWAWKAINERMGLPMLAVGALLGFWASYRLLRRRGELR